MELGIEHVPNPRTSHSRKLPIHGVCIHTTGSGVHVKAAANWRGLSDPTQVAVALYTDKGANFPHYVVGNKVVQIAAEDQRAWHVGIDTQDRQKYLSGTWKRMLSKDGLALWNLMWNPRFKHPLELSPSMDPNTDFVGIELIPEKDGTFNDKQYKNLAKLIRIIFERQGLFDPLADRYDYWVYMRNIGRLVGHEDLSPLTRWNKNGGWDPGALNKNPKFHWNKLIKNLVGLG